MTPIHQNKSPYPCSPFFRRSGWNLISKNLIAAALTVAFLGLSCNDLPNSPKIDYEPEINVFGLLILNNNQKNIKLERTYKVTDYFPSAPNRAVTDARVIVRSNDQEVEFKHLFEGNYSDIQDKLTLKAGYVYQLDVTLADGRKVFAETTMPSKPQIITPSKGDTLPAFRLLGIEWQPALFSRAYAVTVYAPNGDFELTVYTEETQLSFFGFLFAPPARYTLKVSALDENLYDYFRTRSNREPLLHIEGGIGVFGSMAYQAVQFEAR